MKTANRLVKEKSLYLRQHAYNPVDWFPWGEEALKKAKEEEKPLFISIGYSSCHWCHVMERESFEDEEVARILNENFVPVKVDREERPDVDRFYMEACQAMTGSGGWPLTVVATPDGKPFFAGTYIPKERLLRVLTEIARMWKEEREKLLSAGEEVVKHLKNFSLESQGEVPEVEELVESYLLEMESRFDEINGGFSPPPKFPQPHNLWLLTNLSALYGKERAFEMAAYTLKAMRLGGIYDQIGGGFHRYSVDGMWFVPHFEKMLYDQAGLLVAYSTAYSYSSYWLFKETVNGILQYLKREMESPYGTFYSAQDADSEGEEGRYYLWRWEELKEVLTPEELEFSRHLYNLSPEGNYENGYNLPFIGRDLERVAEELGMELKELLKKKGEVDGKLLSEREKRVKPLRDEKILTDWNGYLLWGIVSAYRSTEDSKLLKTAQKLYSQISETHYRNGELYHAVYDGEPKERGVLDDYAFTVRGTLELYLVTGEGELLKKAALLTQKAVKLFYDETSGNLFISNRGELPIRQKELLDGAYPCGNGVMLQNLSLLYHLTGESLFRKTLEKSLSSLSNLLKKHPSAAASSLEALVIYREFQRVEGREEKLKELPFRPYRLTEKNEKLEKLKVCYRGSCREV